MTEIYPLPPPFSDDEVLQLLQAALGRAVERGGPHRRETGTCRDGSLP